MLIFQGCNRSWWCFYGLYHGIHHHLSPPFGRMLFTLSKHQINKSESNNTHSGTASTTMLIFVTPLKVLKLFRRNGFNNHGFSLQHSGGRSWTLRPARCESNISEFPRNKKCKNNIRGCVYNYSYYLFVCFCCFSIKFNINTSVFQIERIELFQLLLPRMISMEKAAATFSLSEWIRCLRDPRSKKKETPPLRETRVFGLGSRERFCRTCGERWCFCSEMFSMKSPMWWICCVCLPVVWSFLFQLSWANLRKHCVCVCRCCPTIFHLHISFHNSCSYLWLGPPFTFTFH